MLFTLPLAAVMIFPMGGIAGRMGGKLPDSFREAARKLLHRVLFLVCWRA